MSHILVREALFDLRELADQTSSSTDCSVTQRLLDEFKTKTN
jgi:hypothetical protein